jgi:hypothetical protein
MSYRGPLTCFTVLFFLSIIAPGFAAEPKFEPGELLIGYMTSNDRDRAIKKLAGAKDALRVRGERLEGVEAQPIAGNAVKLRLTFSAHVLSARRNNPSEEVADLQEVAKQLKETDPSVQYAHPNWIAEVRVEPPSGAKAQETKAKETKAKETKVKETKVKEAKVKETKAREASPHPHGRVASVHRSSRHKHSHAATRLAFEHHHRHHGVKQPSWWSYDLYWSFSFSSSCWDRTKAHPKGHHSHGQCRRDAMR